MMVRGEEPYVEGGGAVVASRPLAASLLMQDFRKRTLGLLSMFYYASMMLLIHSETCFSMVFKVLLVPSPRKLLLIAQELRIEELLIQHFFGSFRGGFVGMDAWKDELLPSSNTEFNDFKRKHEELQNKLYGLAEHNDMLKQSLLERDNLLQKWEEVLNGVDVPSQLRSLDPEDIIEWLKRAFAEVQQEMDYLLLKIENLEVSSDMLIVDLEESHKKIFELSAEVVAVKSGKEFFSESQGIL